MTLNLTSFQTLIGTNGALGTNGANGTSTARDGGNGSAGGRGQSISILGTTQSFIGDPGNDFVNLARTAFGGFGGTPGAGGSSSGTVFTESANSGPPSRTFTCNQVGATGGSRFDRQNGGAGAIGQAGFTDITLTGEAVLMTLRGIANGGGGGTAGSGGRAGLGSVAGGDDGNGGAGGNGAGAASGHTSFGSFTNGVGSRTNTTTYAAAGDGGRGGNAAARVTGADITGSDLNDTVSFILSALGGAGVASSTRVTPGATIEVIGTPDGQAGANGAAGAARVGVNTNLVSLGNGNDTLTLSFGSTGAEVRVLSLRLNYLIISRI